MKISGRPLSYGKSYSSKADDKVLHGNRGKAIGQGGTDVTNTAGGMHNEALSSHSQSGIENSETAGEDSNHGHDAGHMDNTSQQSRNDNAYGHQTDAEQNYAHDVAVEGFSRRSQDSGDDSGPVGIAQAGNRAHKNNPGNAYGHNKDAVNKPAGSEKNDVWSGSTQSDLYRAGTSGGDQSAMVSTEGAHTTRQRSLPTSATTAQPMSAYAQQWVRIPFPLSPFYPPLPVPAPPLVPAPPAPDGTVTGMDPEANTSSAGLSNKSENPHPSPNPNSGAFVSAQHRYSAISGWFGSQAREDTVDSLNEAGDAIWKNTRSSPRDDFDSEDL